MSSIYDDLFNAAELLNSAASQFDLPEIKDTLKGLEKAASNVGKSWCGSWLGYHSKVYYQGLKPVPPGARFSQEWGLMNNSFIFDTVGEWAEYDFDYVHQAIYSLANCEDLNQIEELTKKARNAFWDNRIEITSLLISSLEQKEDGFVKRVKKEVDDAKILYSSDFIALYRPSGALMTRDMVAMGQGLLTPPHFAVITHIMEIRQAGKACETLAKLAKQVASHLAKRERYARRGQEIGTKVFIGHGRSPIWRDLKDFIQDRLGLLWDEFNRIPIAGITNIARLSQMLDDSAIAFLVMTAEDEQADGRLHARLNVIHEAGLFQGRIGFTKAVVLLEEGCEEFSNIQGLGQIRFPKENIKAIFEDIRQVLEREEVI